LLVLKQAKSGLHRPFALFLS